jgi:hypothetical protein
MLEYLRLGIPIITTAVGGIVDSKGAGLRLPVEADGERVAEVLAEVLREPARYATMRRSAARDGVAYRSDQTANEMLSLLDGSTPDTKLAHGRSRCRGLDPARRDDSLGGRLRAPDLLRPHVRTRSCRGARLFGVFG